MTGIDEGCETNANILCKSCGLCCTGHLFTWTKLRSAELDSAEAVGLNVLRSSPQERGFNQPCPLWQGQCTIYSTPQYPRFCHTYKCKLLKLLLDESTTLREAVVTVEQAKHLIHELERLLPESPNPNFRERLVSQLEKSTEQADSDDKEFRLKAKTLIRFYKQHFGLTDMFDMSEEE